MKRWILLTLLMVFVAVPAHATKKDPCESKYLGAILNECSPHTVDTDTDTNTHRDKDDFSAGPGLDFFLWKADKFDVESQSKYDATNENGSSYVVVKIKSEKGLLQNVGGFLKGIFKKDN